MKCFPKSTRKQNPFFNQSKVFNHITTPGGAELFHLQGCKKLFFSPHFPSCSAILVFCSGCDIPLRCFRCSLICSSGSKTWRNEGLGLELPLKLISGQTDHPTPFSEDEVNSNFSPVLQSPVQLSSIHFTHPTLGKNYGSDWHYFPRCHRDIVPFHFSVSVVVNVI